MQRGQVHVFGRRLTGEATTPVAEKWTRPRLCNRPADACGVLDSATNRDLSLQEAEVGSGIRANRYNGCRWENFEMNEQTRVRSTPISRRGGRVLLSLLAVAALCGCGDSTPSKDKPTSDEIRQMRAQFEPEKTAEPTVVVAASPTFPAQPSGAQLYHPWGVKETAVDALGRIGEGAVPNLIDALSASDPRVRAQAARALARIGPDAKEAVPTLMQHLNDPDEDVRQSSARALGQIGPAAEPAVPALIAVIESADGKAPPALTVPKAPVSPPAAAPPRVEPRPIQTK